MTNKSEEEKIDEIIENMLKEISHNASHRFGQIKYKKVFYGIPDSIFDDSFREIEYCYTFGFFEASISLIGTCLEKSLKSELVRRYKIDNKKLVELNLSKTIKKAKYEKLISNGIHDKAKRVDKIRNKYVHVHISKLLRAEALSVRCGFG